MSLKLIAFLMTGILAVLFIGTYFYAPKMKKKSYIEALFFEEVLKLKKQGITTPTDKLKHLAQELSTISGESPKTLLKQIGKN